MKRYHDERELNCFICMVIALVRESTRNNRIGGFITAFGTIEYH